MAKAAINKEISGKDTSKALFQALTASHGAYVIISLKDDLAPDKLAERRQLMMDEVDKLVPAGSVAIDFSIVPHSINDFVQMPDIAGARLPSP